MSVNSAVSPLLFSPKKLTTFFVITVTFIDFTRVSPPEGVTPRLFTCSTTSFVHILCKFSHNFFLRVSVPLEGVTRGGPPPRPPTYVIHLGNTEMDMGWFHPSVGLGWVG